jgi:type I restriction enzyme S subunit
VTLKDFFKTFDLFADAPNAVMKMRQLILTFAVQGRLVAQNPNDEPAQALLKKTPPTSKVSQVPADDFAEPFRIPTTWAWIRLPRVLTKLTDGTHHSPPNASSGEFMYVTAKNIKNDGVLLDDITFVTKRVHDEIYARCNPSFGDVLFIKDGATTGIVTINQLKEPFSMLSSVALLKPSPAVFNRYLLWAMRSPFFYEETRGGMKGAAITRVTLSVMAESLLPLPPLAEQKRIVAKVDQLMALCDQLEAQQQERETRHTALARASLARFAEAPNPTNLNLLFHKSYSIPPADLRKSILTLAVQGKLVSQNPDEEVAHQLLIRVADEKFRLVQSKVIKSERPLDPISDNEALFRLPDKWAWCRAGDLCRSISSGSTPEQSVFSRTEGVPYLKVYNIRNQKVDFEYKAQFIPAAYHREKMKRSTLIPGDVIMNIVGPPLGKVAIIPETFPEWNCNQAIAFFRPVFREFAPYIYMFLKQGSFLKNIELIGTAGQDNISVTKCKFIPIPIPPLPEQRRIVAKVDELMALVDALETQLTTSQTKAAELMEAVVAELTASTRI